MTVILEPAHTHDFAHAIRTVAVIGSGPTGTPAARHLQDAGLKVRLFERQSQSGGIWYWRPAASLPLSGPTLPPSVGAFTPVFRQSGTYEDPDRKERDHFNPPNLCYWNLTNNVLTTTMAFKDYPFPEGTERNVSHKFLADYVHNYAKHFGLDKLASYNTRVEKAEKVDHKWMLNLRKVVDEGNEKAREELWSEEFDAVVVATGHYNAPYIPPINGVDAWAAAWPTKVIHSQGYRVPEPYEGKTVLLVGIGTSDTDIARDLDPYVEKTYLVGRNKLRGPPAYQRQRKLQRFMVSEKGESVAEIQRFVPPNPGQPIEEAEVELKDGRILKGISEVIFATGYQYSFPFLPRHHSDYQGVRSERAEKHPLVTDGSGVLNLWRDVFYIPDPPLTFIGLSVNTSAFSFFEYQSISIARVLSGKAKLPDEATRWANYAQLVKEKGEGKFSHLLNKDGERSYVRDTVEWLNREAQWSGAELIEGHSFEWLAESDKMQELFAVKYGITPEQLRQISEEINAGDGQDQEAISKDFATAADETNARAIEGLARRVGAVKA
ncbi:dimethylaniline monooxygenase [Kwoniella mangroviensis CBS 8886]|nr:dimethylaniline monooxygenase [Kwoniella mangroviensis CBS 8886]